MRKNTIDILGNIHRSEEAAALYLLIFCLLLTDLPTIHRHQYVLLWYFLICCDKTWRNILQVRKMTSSVVLYFQGLVPLRLYSHPICHLHLHMGTIIIRYYSPHMISYSNHLSENVMITFSLNFQLSLTTDNKGITSGPNFLKTSAYTLQGHTFSTWHSQTHTHTHTHWSIKPLAICISKGLLRPSSQQGQGTFILIYSKGRFSFNFLHIHKRVSHPRSRFPFQL